MRSVLATSAVLLAGAAALADGRVETIDARTLDGKVLSITSEQVVVEADKAKQSLPLGDVVEITFADAPDLMATPDQRVVKTALGDLLAVDDVTFDGRGLRIAGGLVGDAAVRMADVRAIYLPGVGQSPGDVEKRYAAMKLPAASGDRVLVTRPGKQPLAVDGVLEAIDDTKITFRWKEQSRTLARDTVPVVYLAAVGGKASKRKGVLVGRDGSTLSFTDLTFDGKAFSLTSAVVGTCSIAPAKVAAVRLASGSVTKLADLKPTAVTEYGYFDTTFTHRVNQSVSGKPLRLGGRTYRTGLGLHSFCELTYDVAGRYTAFVATVGIDDEVRPNGDVTLTLLGDGKPLGKPLKLTGKDAPQAVRVKLDGVKTLKVRVDFGGDGLGFCDHVDLAGARLLK